MVSEEKNLHSCYDFGQDKINSGPRDSSCPSLVEAVWKQWMETEMWKQQMEAAMWKQWMEAAMWKQWMEAAMWKQWMEAAMWKQCGSSIQTLGQNESSTQSPKLRSKGKVEVTLPQSCAMRSVPGDPPSRLLHDVRPTSCHSGPARTGPPHIFLPQCPNDPSVLLLSKDARMMQDTSPGAEDFFDTDERWCHSNLQVNCCSQPSEPWHALCSPPQPTGPHGCSIQVNCCSQPSDP